jgi:hypothetical protein
MASGSRPHSHLIMDCLPVWTPTYRGADFIRATIDTALAQSCSRLGVWVVEAIFKADRTEEIAQVFGLLPSSAIIRREPPGAGSGRIAATSLVRRCVRAGTNLIGEPGNGLIRRIVAERSPRAMRRIRISSIATIGSGSSRMATGSTRSGRLRVSAGSMDHGAWRQMGFNAYISGALTLPV